MSFSIGPFIGRREHVIRKVKSITPPANNDNTLFEHSRAFILIQLEKNAEGSTCTAHGCGHDGTGYSSVIANVNQHNSNYGIPELVDKQSLAADLERERKAAKKS